MHPNKCIFEFHYHQVFKVPSSDYFLSDLCPHSPVHEEKRNRATCPKSHRPTLAKMGSDSRPAWSLAGLNGPQHPVFQAAGGDVIDNCVFICLFHYVPVFGMQRDRARRRKERQKTDFLVHSTGFGLGQSLALETKLRSPKWAGGNSRT